jgi:predicted secreted protein
MEIYSPIPPVPGTVDVSPAKAGIAKAIINTTTKNIFFIFFFPQLSLVSLLHSPPFRGGPGLRLQQT